MHWFTALERCGTTQHCSAHRLQISRSNSTDSRSTATKISGSTSGAVNDATTAACRRSRSSASATEWRSDNSTFLSSSATGRHETYASRVRYSQSRLLAASFARWKKKATEGMSE